MVADDSLLHDLHFQTKLASPLLPLISLDSNRLTLTGFGCTSRQDVHWTLKVYQKGLSAVSTGWSSVTPTKSAVSVIDSIFVVDFCGPRRTEGMVGLILGREITGVRELHLKQHCSGHDDDPADAWNFTASDNRHNRHQLRFSTHVHLLRKLLTTIFLTMIR